MILGMRSSLPGFSPVVSQSFLALSPGYTTVTPSSANSSVSRAGNATLFDSTGKLTYAPNNLLTYSEDFTNASWSVAASGGGTTGVKTPNYSGATAPDGTNTACRVQLDVSGGAAGAQSQMYKSFTFVGTILASAWVKTTDNSTKTIKGFSVSGLASPPNLTVTGTWTRLSAIVPSSGANNIQIILVKGETSDTADLLVWHPQVEAVTYQTTPSTYVATTASAYYGPRYDYNPSTLASKGLLVEAAATNSKFPSANLVTSIPGMTVTSSNISPDGTSTAYGFTEDATAVERSTLTTYGAAPPLSLSQGQTVSFFVKREAGASTRYIAALATNIAAGGAFYDLAAVTATVSSSSAFAATITTVGNGFFRCTLTRVDALSQDIHLYVTNVNTPYSGSKSYTGDGVSKFVFWGFQRETGSFATSYIPTTSASVTRAAETYTRTAYTSQLVMATYTDEQTGLTYYVNLNPGNTWAGNGWITSLRAYDGTTATVPTWLDVSATTGNRMLTDSTGKLTYAPNNLLTYSEQFNNAVWTKNLGGVGSVPVVTPDAGTAPDGTTTADRIVFTLNGGTAAADVSDVRHAPTTLASIYIFSFWIRSFDGVSSYNMLIRDANGFVNSIAVSGTWTRVSKVATYAAGTSTIGFGIRGGQTPVNPNTADVLVWGAQLEAVTYQTTPSTYNATTTAAYYGPRFDYDPSTLAAKGLLIEESRANTVLQSQAFNISWSLSNVLAFGGGSVVDATVAPDGTTTAEKIVENAIASTHSVNQSFATTSAAWTFSVYAKKDTRNFLVLSTYDSAAVQKNCWFNLATGAVGTVNSGCTGTIIPIGNGWYRCVMTLASAFNGGGNTLLIGMSNADNVLSYTGDGVSGLYIWGAQVELGSFATSYIPTTTASVTRAADIIKLSGAALTAISGSAFSAVAETSGVQNTSGLVLARSGGSVLIQANFSTTAVAWWNGTALLGASFPSGTWSSTQREAVAGDGTGRSMAVSNSTVATDAGALSDRSVMYIGSNVGTSAMSGYVRALSIYNKRLPDATLKSKSVVGSPL